MIVYSELGTILLKLFLANAQMVELGRYADMMLLKPLGSDFRKTVEMLKAKVG
jgi:hypothetical protein